MLETWLQTRAAVGGDIVRRKRHRFCGPVAHRQRSSCKFVEFTILRSPPSLPAFFTNTDEKRDLCLIPPRTSRTHSRGVNSDSTERCNGEGGLTEENLIRMGVNAISSVVSDGTGEGFGGDENGKSSTEGSSRRRLI